MMFWNQRKKLSPSKNASLTLERLEERAMMAVIPLASGQTAKFRDADGTEVKVKLVGPGQGSIELVGGVLTGAAIDTLTLTGTTGQTKLKINTRGGTIPGTTINDVVIDNAINELGALKQFKGKNVWLTGQFTADGNIDNFQVRSLGNDSSVDVTGDVGRFKAESLANNAQLDVSGTLREFVAKLLSAGSTVEANQIDMLKVKQQAIGASFNVGAGGLASAKLGWIYDSTFTAEGAIGDVVVKGDAMSTGFASNVDKGSDGILGTIDDFVMDPTATGYVGQLRFRGNVGGLFPSQMVSVVSSGSVGNVQTRSSQAANVNTLQSVAPVFIPLSISQLTAAATGFDDDEIYIAVFGEEISIPPQGVAPSPAQNYYLSASDLKNGKPKLTSTKSLVPSASTPNLPIVPSSTIGAWQVGTTNAWGSNLQLPVPITVGNQFTGRIVISAGAPVQAQVNQDTYHSVSAPSASDFTDPSTGTFYDFLEFTVTNSATTGISLDMDTSQVDSFGMPIGLQFFQDAAGTQPYNTPFQGTTSLSNPLQITGVATLNTMVTTENFGTGQPVDGPGIQAGTVVSSYDIDANTITLNKPVTAANTNANFTAYPAGIVGVQADRSTILTGFTDDGLFQFLQTKLENGNPQARPFLQTATPYAVQDAKPLTGATTLPVVISTADTTGLSTSDHVTVTGVLDNVAANGTFAVAAVTPTSFTLGAPISNGSAGGAWSLAGSSTTPILSGSSTNAQPVVIQTANTVGLQNGDSVVITGATGNTAANGLHTVSAVTSTSFTLADVDGNGVAISDGAWLKVEPITTTSTAGTSLVITTSHTDQVEIGGVVTINGLTGAEAPNGSFLVADKSVNSITLGSPAGLGGYVTNTGSWTGSMGGGGAVTGATNGGEILITAASTAGLSNGDLLQISGVGGNQAANGFYFIGDLTPTSFVLSGSSGSGTYTSGGTWQVHIPAIRLVSPKDIVESLATAQDENGLNNYYNEVIDAFFLQYFTGTMNGHVGGGKTFSLQSTAYDGTVHTYTGSVTNAGTANNNYALQLKDSATMGADPTTYNIYYPWFNYATATGTSTNAPAADLYTPVFTLATAPSWITANAWQTQSASQMIFGCDAIFADNVARAAIDMTAPNAVKVLGDLENSISAAFNRGIVLDDAANWYDTTQWFPENGIHNYWVEYWHQTGLMYSDLAYAFPYDDKFGASTNLDIGDVGLAKVTLGSWGTRTAPTVSFTHVPQNAAPDSEVTFTAQVSGTNPTGTVTFFINGIPINPDDDSLTAPMRPIDLDGTGLASVTATLPALPSGANAATYTVTAIYSGDATYLPSIVSTSLPLTSALTVAVAPAAGVLGATVQVSTTLPDANSSGTLTYSISKSDGSNPQTIGTPQQVTSQNMQKNLAIPTNVVTFTGDADGSNMITGISSMVDLLQGQTISGVGVPTGTTIIGTGADSITLSNTVAAGTGVTFTSNGKDAVLPITVTFTPTNNQLPTVVGGTDFTVDAAAYSLALSPGSGGLGSTPKMTVTLPGPPYDGSIEFEISRPDGTDVQSLGSVSVSSSTLTNGNQVAVDNLPIPNDLLQFTAYANGSTTITGISTTSGLVTNTQNIDGGGVSTNYITGYMAPVLQLTSGAAHTSTDPVTFSVNGVTITGTTVAGQQAVTVTSVSGWTPSSVLDGQAITDNDNDYYVGGSNTVQTFTAGSATMHVAVPSSNGAAVTFTSSANGSAYPITAVWTPAHSSALTSPPQLFGVT
jgi:Beta-1,3-glucanase/Bacterial Ig-like domain (group 3)